jgi:hypothetical protein
LAAGDSPSPPPERRPAPPLPGNPPSSRYMRATSTMSALPPLPGQSRRSRPSLGCRSILDRDCDSGSRGPRVSQLGSFVSRPSGEQRFAALRLWRQRSANQRNRFDLYPDPQGQGSRLDS